MHEYERFMQKAIALAEQGRGAVSPNPLVGAVVVKRGKIIAQGHHSSYGKEHAEVGALKTLNPKVKADLYVSLEPCAHHGKTPPCLDLIKQYPNLQKIVIGCKDPNPQVNGKSIRQLKKKGFDVITGVLAEEVKKQNETYFYYMATKRPFVTLKAAISLDGQMASSNRESKWITSADSRERAHKLRTEHDAIMVGIGTVVSDDPLLIPRNVGRRFRPPARIIIDPRLRIPLDSKIVKTAKAYPTMIVCKRVVDRSKLMQLEKQSIKIIHQADRQGRFSIAKVMDDLGSRGISSVMIEGGSKLNSWAWKEKVVNKVVFFAAPKIFGGNTLPVIGGDGIDSLSNATNLQIYNVQYLDPDILIEAYVKASGS